MRQADFICIGFQKSGTSTLYEILKQHPAIALTRDVKEPMFYRAPFFRVIFGKEWYAKRYFGHLSDDDTRLRGEINAGLAMNSCAKWLGKDFPKETKLIFLMRNPADRCYSAYKYFLARGFLPARYFYYDKQVGHAKGFDRYVKECLSSQLVTNQIMKKRLKYLCFSQGNYGTSIEEYLEYFPKENIKLLLFEEFVRHPKEVCEELYQFLGVPNCDNIDYFIKANEGNWTAKNYWGSEFRYLAVGLDYFFFEFLDFSRRLPKFYKKFSSAINIVMDAMFEEETDRDPMFEETRQLLDDYYRDEVAKTEALMGRSLAGIWKTADAAEDARAQEAESEVAAIKNLQPGYPSKAHVKKGMRVLP